MEKNQTKTMQVSVVVPVYNGGKTLRACLQSILSQDYSVKEILVVDNNSTDETKNIIKSFEQVDQRVRYLFESYRSRGAARNRGVEVASGDVICMTDSDCIVPTHWVSVLLKPIEVDGEDIVMGTEKSAFHNFWTESIQRANERFFDRNREGQYIQCIDTKNFAIRSQIIKRFRFDKAIKNLEEFEFFLRIKEQYCVRFLPDLKVKHYHKATRKDWFAINFDRGRWAKWIYKKHQGSKVIINEPMFESFSLKNNLVFPFWLIYQLFRQSIRDFYFISITEISWRMGIFIGRRV